jgi:hypothetical protein
MVNLDENESVVEENNPVADEVRIQNKKVLFSEFK